MEKGIECQRVWPGNFVLIIHSTEWSRWIDIRDG